MKLYSKKTNKKKTADGAGTKWDTKQKMKAITLAETLGTREAARQTGIPRGTLNVWWWRVHQSERGRMPEPPYKPPQKLRDLAAQAAQEATEEVRDYIIDRLKSLADELYTLAEEGVRELRQFLANPETKDRDSAAWLRAVVGAMHYAIQDAQLLSGKPTTRPEVMDRHEYEITQRILADPEAVVLAENLLLRAAGRDAGSLRLDCERGEVDTL